MPTTQRRIDLLVQLGEYMASDAAEWQEVQERAIHANSWFTPAHVTMAVNNIAREFLQREKLEVWLTQYQLPTAPKRVGIVMAGNIPLVGFHDFLCGFVSGHILYLKLSSKDTILLSHLIRKLVDWEPEVAMQVHIAENLKGCDAYIATGSNNTARYFEQYFAKYPHIIRKNRTSVAVLDGTETKEELESLGEDIFSYYGLGCRNVTQIAVPEGYDFAPLLDALKKYDDLTLHHKYKNNYDYHLAIYLLNRVPYMTNDTVLLVENELPFSAVSVLHYRYYANGRELMNSLNDDEQIQCVVGNGALAFGSSQKPSLNDYADGVDVMQFLCHIGS